MIKIIQKEQTHSQNYEWMHLYSLFSFANYFEPDNTCFGIVPTFNEYIVEAGHGFQMHPHQDMELFYLILNGEMEHKDSLGNEQILEAGCLQRISAGSGIARSAYNNGSDPLNYITIWMLPVAEKLTPSQEVKYFDKSLFLDKFFPMASNRHNGTNKANSPVRSNANGTIYRAYFSNNKAHLFNPEGSHQLIYVLYGSLTINSIKLTQGGHARISGEKSIELLPSANTDIIIVDMISRKNQ